MNPFVEQAPRKSNPFIGCIIILASIVFWIGLFTYGGQLFKSLCERYSPWVKYEAYIKPIREQWQKERHDIMDPIKESIWNDAVEMLKVRFPEWAKARTIQDSLEWSHDHEAYYAAQDAANAIAARDESEFHAVEQECRRRIQETEERVLKPKYPQFYK